MVVTGMFKQVEVDGGGQGLKYQRDVESHNGGLGAGYLYGSSAHEVVLKKFETHMF